MRGEGNRRLILVAMTFAVSMTFIDQTIVALAVPELQRDLGLSGGLVPTGDVAEAWLIFFRVVQGAGAALMFPAASAIIVAAFPVADRGKAMAAFFGITGALTAVGPIAGGYLTEWTWRSIFWINLPVAVIALSLTALASRARSVTRRRSTGPARRAAPGGRVHRGGHDRMGRAGAGRGRLRGRHDPRPGRVSLRGGSDPLSRPH
jgi:Major Facilitator Superfamily